MSDIILIPMSNRMNMLQFTLDDSDEEAPQPPTPLTAERPKPRDLFQSTQVTRNNIFMGSQYEEPEYVIMPVMLPKKDPKPEKEGKSIKVLQELDYDEEETESLPENIQQAELSTDFKKEESPEKQEDSTQEVAQHSEILNVHASSRQMLSVVLSSGSDSATEGREDEEDSTEPQQNSSQKFSPSPSQPPPSPPSPPKSTLKKYDRSSTILQGVTDVKQFMQDLVMQPVPVGKLLQLAIFRKTSGLNTFWPEYELIFGGDGSALNLHAKKMMGSTTSNHYITTLPGIQSIDHPAFIGKMRGNFSGSIYHIFDNGVNPEKSTKFHKPRTIQATIRFKSQLMTLEPRSFEVFLLAEGVSYNDLYGVIPMKEIGLEALYERKENRGRILHFMNRRPIYSQAFKGYILNFGGRVQKPSIKNFILQDIDGERQEVLMLGKTSDEIFRLDVSSPIPPYLALCIALANFDSKFLSD